MQRAAAPQPNPSGQASLRPALFRYLSYTELVRVANIAQTVDVPAGQPVFSAGQPGDAMYVVLDGSVRLARGDQQVAELARGQHFGELALVDRSVRSLTATAGDGTRLIEITRVRPVEVRSVVSMAHAEPAFTARSRGRRAVPS